MPSEILEHPLLYEGPRMAGEFPGLTKGLDRDRNLRATSDFRCVYASLVERWFNVDAARSGRCA